MARPAGAPLDTIEVCAELATFITGIDERVRETVRAGSSSGEPPPSIIPIETRCFC